MMPGVTFNLGTGTGYCLNEVLDMVEKVAQKPIKRVLQPKNPNEPFKLIADSTEAQKTLGWTPTLSDLETIVSTAYHWHKRQNS